MNLRHVLYEAEIKKVQVSYILYIPIEDYFVKVEHVHQVSK